jgi:hypothetical protein
MKHSRILFIIALVSIFTLLGLSGCGTQTVATAGQTTISNQQDGIWVTGEGKVTVKPDIANISLGVSSQEASVADAMAKTKDAMSKVMAALKADKIADADIQTQQYSINPTYSYNQQNGTQTISGYQVTNIVNVKLRDTSTVAAVINDVTTAGGDLTQINNVNFTVEDPTKYYDDARQKAVDDASAKAKDIAAAYKVTLGKPTYIIETSSTPYQIEYSNGAGPAIMSGQSSTSVNAGSTDIVLDVQVSYSILP